MPPFPMARASADDVDQRGTDQAPHQGVEPSCWICLGDASDGALRSFCACPGRHAHERCLARWCLQQAGRDEEKRCRFCKDQLPDYKATLLGKSDTASVAAGPHQAAPPAPTSAPNIRVHYGNVTIVMPLQPGERGKREFEAGIRKILGLPQDQALNINFQCKEPGSDQADSKVQLSGLHTYDAAFWCVSQAAAERRSSSSAGASSPTATSSSSDVLSSQSDALLGSPTAGVSSAFSGYLSPAAAMPRPMLAPAKTAKAASLLKQQQSQRQQLQQYSSSKAFVPPALIMRQPPTSSSSGSKKPGFFSKQFSKLMRCIG